LSSSSPSDGRQAGKFIKQPIVAFERDDEGVWVAVLACGHGQHVRHNPPWSHRPWVLTEEGRARFIGFELECRRCAEPADR
jgi:hypothetical protein